MPQGLQVFDASGNVVLDLGTSTGRFIGSVTTGSVGGSVTSAALATGTPFYTILLLSGADLGLKSPDVSFSGDTMTWTYSGATAINNAIILYGVM